MERARHGDAKACIELSEYYSFIALDEKRAIDWLRRAVELEPDNDLWRRNLRVMTTGEDDED
jgi:hypothetical protein